MIKTLYAFDLDDTLFSHNDLLKIYVKDKNHNTIQELTNKQFNSYKLNQNEYFDFSNFRSSKIFTKSSIPIPNIINLLKNINDNVNIITARADFDDKELFQNHLNSFGIDINKIHVRRAGNLNYPKIPKAKSRIIDDLIIKYNYNIIHLYDDSKDNLKQFLKLKYKHPNVNLIAHHIIHETNQVIIKKL